MSASPSFSKRAGIGVSVLLGCLFLAVILRFLGVSEPQLYWTLFAVSIIATLASLAVVARLSTTRSDDETQDFFFRKVLFVEQEPTLENNLARVFQSQGASVDAMKVSAAVAESVVRSDYDLIVADAALPYLELYHLKSLLLKEAPTTGFVVVQISVAYPTKPNIRRFEIVESSGPPRLRKEIEGVLDLQPA